MAQGWTKKGRREGCTWLLQSDTGDTVPVALGHPGGTLRNNQAVQVIYLLRKQPRPELGLARIKRTPEASRWVPRDLPPVPPPPYQPRTARSMLRGPGCLCEVTVPTLTHGTQDTPSCGDSQDLRGDNTA